MPEPAPADPPQASLLDRQQAFGYTQEDLRVVLTSMAVTAEEAIDSMGNDAALPVLGNRPKILYNYFKQLFAQVTNPPIDPIREELVMSLVSFIGPRPNLLALDPSDDGDGNGEPPMRLEVGQPILTAENMEKLRRCRLFSGGAFKCESWISAIPRPGARTAWKLRSRASPRTRGPRSGGAATS